MAPITLDKTEVQSGSVSEPPIRGRLSADPQAPWSHEEDGPVSAAAGLCRDEIERSEVGMPAKPPLRKIGEFSRRISAKERRNMTIDDEAIRAAARRIVLEVGDPEASKENMLRFEELVFDWRVSLRRAGMSLEVPRRRGQAARGHVPDSRRDRCRRWMGRARRGLSNPAALLSRRIGITF